MRQRWIPHLSRHKIRHCRTPHPLFQRRKYIIKKNDFVLRKQNVRADKPHHQKYCFQNRMLQSANGSWTRLRVNQGEAVKNIIMTILAKRALHFDAGKSFTLRSNASRRMHIRRFTYFASPPVVFHETAVIFIYFFTISP